MPDEYHHHLERLAHAFLPIMHIFHHLAGRVVRLTDFSLAQYRVVMLVYRNRAMSINQLKQSLNIAQSTASGMIDRLVQQNVLYREKDPHDRRITLFKLTPHTEQIISEHFISIENIYQELLQPLSIPEQKQLVEGFETILKLLQKSRH